MSLNFDETINKAEKQLNDLNHVVSTDQIGRSLNYLYLKETKSSTEIEREDSRQNKTQRFFQVLKSSGSIPLSKQRLITIQNQIVPANKGDLDYRTEEIWVGEQVRAPSGMFENFHFIAPKHEKVPDMMQGLLDMHYALLHEPSVPSLVHAAIVSFMFVYIHPFMDGNGRTHRYLIHDILKSRSVKKDFIVPVSSAILNNMSEYDRVLEILSKPVMALLQYEFLEDQNTIRIDSDIDHLYQFPDLTEHVVFLHNMMDIAFNEELVEEVFYVLMFDAVKRTINMHYDKNEKELNLIVNLLLQNGGKFSIRKRKNLAKIYTQEDIHNMQKIAKDTIKIIDGFRMKISKDNT